MPREVIEWALRRQRLPEKLVQMVMLLYDGTTSRVKTVAGKSEKFKIGVGVHQGSALSPLLFIAVMEEATKECRGEGLFELLYADDLVLTGETREEAKEMFIRWKSGIERRGLKINMEKTKVMVSGRNRQQEERRGSQSHADAVEEVCMQTQYCVAYVVGGATRDALDCEE